MRKTPLTNEEANELYLKYKNTMSEEDYALLGIVLEHEELFDDMCLELNSSVHDFVAYNDGDFGGEVSDDHYIDLLSQKWRFYVKKFRDKNRQGITYCNERKIEIGVSYKNNLPTILHEMIHAHEEIINGMLPFFHDIVLLSLYKELSEKIPDLNNRIVMHTHEYYGTEITYQGGSHNILFFLKSLDLDLKLGYKLGTVCGYGRDEYESQK